MKHQQEEHHRGCLWDTRREQGASGLRACFADGRLAIEAFGPSNSSGPVPVPVVVADGPVPLSTWVHLAVQRNGHDLEFFMDGNPGGKARGTLNWQVSRRFSLILSSPCCFEHLGTVGTPEFALGS